MQINMTGFLNGKNARQFMDELWALLLSAQESETGIPYEFIQQKKEEMIKREEDSKLLDDIKRENDNEIPGSGGGDERDRFVRSRSKEGRDNGRSSQSNNHQIVPVTSPGPLRKPKNDIIKTVEKQEEIVPSEKENRSPEKAKDNNGKQSSSSRARSRDRGRSSEKSSSKNNRQKSPARSKGNRRYSRSRSSHRSRNRSTERRRSVNRNRSKSRSRSKTPREHSKRYADKERAASKSRSRSKSPRERSRKDRASSRSRAPRKSDRSSVEADDRKSEPQSGLSKIQKSLLNMADGGRKSPHASKSDRSSSRSRSK